jgi:23S rRNA (cytidine1920-2'-O)/16S rRNA (cytidine1409-2'-O)-methyltransferase
MSSSSNIAQRADVALVERGFFDTRSRAQEAILAGLVTANGQTIRKTSEKLGADAVITAVPPHPWVSRGGMKLDHALKVFGIDPQGLHCLDLGASTGGFCDVLLARGAAGITAVDVGRGQLHPKIAGDPRITALEQCDARSLTAKMLRTPPQLIVCDVSFISLALVLPPVLPLAAQNASLVVLVKPQFEVGRALVGKGGMVRDEAARHMACTRVEALLEQAGWCVKGVCPSPIRGGDGNEEFLVGAYRG